jgi:hypothetical protein
MPVPTSIMTLVTPRIVAIAREVAQEAEGRPRFWGSMIAENFALEGEVTLLTSERIVAADIVALDQKSVMRRATDTYRATFTNVPKFKHGFPIEEHQMVNMLRVAQGNATPQEIGSLDNYVANKLRWLIEGVHDAKELVYSAMMSNQGSYDRLGIKFNNYSWGVQDANLNPPALAGAAAWTNANFATATPIAVIRAMIDYSRTSQAGAIFDGARLSETLLNIITNTNEYQQIAPTFAAAVLVTSIANINTNVLKTMPFKAKVVTLSAILGINIMVDTDYKQRTAIEAEDGALVNTALWDPKDFTLFDSTLFDSNGVDFANAIVIETMPGKVPLILGEDFPEAIPGPVAYATAADPHGDPPGEILWAIQRGWPRLNQWAKKGNIRTS